MHTVGCKASGGGCEQKERVCANEVLLILSGFHVISGAVFLSGL